LEEIAAIAILDDDDFGQAPIGTILLLKQHGQIDELIFVQIEQLISSFYKPLRLALENAFMQEHRQTAEAANIEQSQFLQFVVEMSNFTSTDTLYQTFATDMFRQFAFDGLGFFLLENDLLVNKRVESADPHYQDVSTAWEEYLRGNAYLLDATDGAVSHTFLKNLPLMFPDVQTIVNLPMSEKDRHSLAVLKSIRTLLLVPISCEQKPIGVLAFYSLIEPVNISQTDLLTISNLAAHFGAAISKVNDVATIGRTGT
jgi:two-component system cell cycle response regulator